MEKQENTQVYTEAELKKQAYAEVISDVIDEIDAREDNIKIYYPYFIISKKLKAESENYKIDLTNIFMALLSFLLYTGKLNNKKI